MAIAHRKFVSAVVLLTAAALAGCSAQPGTAAVINGTKITEGELDDATLEYVGLTGQEAQPSVVLNTLLAAEIFPSRRNVRVMAGFMCAPDRSPHRE